MNMFFQESLINDDTRIECLSLSNRAKNALYQHGIYTVSQMLGLTESEVLNMRNIGRRTATEIMDFIDDIYKPEEDDNQQVRLKKPWQLDVMDKSIREIGMSVRAVNCLQRNGIKKVADLVQMKKDEILSIRNCGTQTAQEILEKILQIEQGVIEECRQKQKNEGQIYEKLPDNSFVNAIINKIINTFASSNISPYAVRTAYARHIIVKNADRLSPDFLDGEPSEPEIVMRLTEGLDELFFQAMGTISGANGCLEEQDLAGIFPGVLFTLKEKYLSSWISDERLIPGPGYYLVSYPRAIEYADSLKDSKGGIFLSMKLHGATLEEIGKENGITRERVRQIIKRLLDKRPPLFEDRYRELYQTYGLDAEAMIIITGFEKTSVEYIILTSTRGDKPIEEADIDEMPIYLRAGVERYIFRNHINEDGAYVRRTRNDIALYLLKKHREPVVSDILLDEYNAFLLRHKLQDDVKLSIAKRYLETNFLRQESVLLIRGRRLLYTRVTKADISELLDKIHFYDLHNIEISTAYFLKNYPDVLEEYDIHNEYELHNLLKKHIDNPDVSFGRQPMISIGNADRESQVFDLLIEEAPIGKYELAECYEAKYGVDRSTVLANFFKFIDIYANKGVFSIDYEDLTDEERVVLSNILNDDIIFLPSVRQLYQERLPDHDLHKLNTYNIKLLGYRTSSDIAYRTERYNNIDKIVEELFASGTCDLSDRQWLYRSPSVYAKLYTMKWNRQIFEIGPYLFITMEKVRKMGLTEEMIDDYCEKVRQKANGCIFSLHSLSLHGFSNPYNDIGLSSVFWESVLSTSNWTGHQSFAGTTIFKETQEKRFHRGDLIREIVERYLSIALEDLMDLLFYDYGIQAERFSIIAISQEADIFYSSAKKKFYTDYEQYYTEL